jgi:hypothetical protein
VPQEFVQVENALSKLQLMDKIVVSMVAAVLANVMFQNSAALIL